MEDMTISRSEHNFADILTKAVSGKMFWTLYGPLTTGSS